MKRYLFVSLHLLLLGACLPTLIAGNANQPLQNEAGYMAIEPVTFYFHYGSYFNRLVLRSSQARIWYSFHAADNIRQNTPLFVFFNGGPGSSTSSGLMSMYTGRYTLDNRIEDGGGNVYIPNPVSWTHLGHLLYIDAREAGFSYNLMDLVENEGERFQEFNAQNYNSFFDAADYIRVLLRFLATHPALQDHPVVIVGESYGGIRATSMLHILLNYTDYGNGLEVFQDPALVDEIQAHFDTIFTQYAGQVVPPEVIAQQFGHQVLIQPAITMEYQYETQEKMWTRPGSPLYQIGEEVGIPYDPEVYLDPYDFVDEVAGRDVYIYTKPRDWLNGFFNNAGVLLRFVQNLSLVTGVDVTAIPELYASARGNAYRMISTDYPLTLEPRTDCPITRQLFEVPARLEAPNVRQEPGDMDEVFGTLQPWDRYFIGTNYYSNWAFHVLNVALVRGYDIHFREPRYGRMFLKNVAHIHTFITNAAYDLVVYTAALPSSLAKHNDILASVQHITQGTQVRPGKIVLHYQSSAFPGLPNLNKKTIRFPFYDKSCHAVSLTQPEAIFTDVSNWLEEHGIELR